MIIKIIIYLVTKLVWLYFVGSVSELSWSDCQFSVCCSKIKSTGLLRFPFRNMFQISNGSDAVLFLMIATRLVWCLFLMIFVLIVTFCVFLTVGRLISLLCLQTK